MPDATTALGRAQEAGMERAAVVNRWPLRRVVKSVRVPGRRRGEWSGYDVLDCGHEKYLSGGGSGFGGAIATTKARRCGECHDAGNPR